MKKYILFLLLFLIQSNAFSKSSECVILLHGMGRTAFSMNSLESYLKENGFQTVNHSYPSTSQTIENISRNIIPKFISECNKGATKVHFITHSLGGIISRYYLQTNRLPVGSRVVMLSPPNKGSEIADRFHDSTWYRWLAGPPGQQLTTDSNSLPNRLKPINYEVGIITGRSSLEPWFSRLIPGEDDGKVSVESAKLQEMKDFLVVDHAHTFIMKSDEVKIHVLNFIKYGRFKVEKRESSNKAQKIDAKKQKLDAIYN